MSKVQSAWERRSVASFADQAMWPVIAMIRLIGQAIVPPRSFQVQAFLQGVLVAACVAWKIWGPYHWGHATFYGLIVVNLWLSESVSKLQSFLKNLDEREQEQQRNAREVGLWCALVTALVSPLLVIRDLQYSYFSFLLSDCAFSFMTTFALVGPAFHLPRLFMLGRMLKASEP